MPDTLTPDSHPSHPGHENASPNGAATTTACFAAGAARLQGTLFTIPEMPPRRAILINPATGVPAGFYAPFAAWLTRAHQAAVLTWDYRDFGASGRPYGSRATMTDWAVHDPCAARDWLRGQFPDLPLWVIGHSLGGMALPFQPRLDEIARAIVIAGGPVHLHDHPWPFRAQAWALWHVAGPLSTALLDHLPGRRLGLGNDLPVSVFHQWKRWCTRPGSLPEDPDLPAPERPGLTCPVKLVALDDDVMIPPASVWKLAQWMPAAQTSQTLLHPAEHGLRTVGHIAAFAPRNRVLWPLIMA
ncbi:MAG: alpha/beta hydrolase [Pararhodobacter sp.]|nr:alpha/beta hydrolase [Pararhodobacter sp.]